MPETTPENDARIGVYICYCGGNISDAVDCDQVAAALRDQVMLLLVYLLGFAAILSSAPEIMTKLDAALSHAGPVPPSRPAS